MINVQALGIVYKKEPVQNRNVKWCIMDKTCIRLAKSHAISVLIDNFFVSMKTVNMFINKSIWHVTCSTEK